MKLVHVTVSDAALESVQWSSVVIGSHAGHTQLPVECTLQQSAGDDAVRTRVGITCLLGYGSGACTRVLS